MAERFTIEGDTLYFGRDNWHHGFNLGKLTDIAYNTLEILNAPIDKAEALEQEVERLRDDYKELCRIRKAEAVDNLANERKLARLVELLRGLPTIGGPHGNWYVTTVELNRAIKAATEEGK